MTDNSDGPTLKNLSLDEAYQKGLEDASSGLDADLLRMALKGTIAEAVNHDFNNHCGRLQTGLYLLKRNLNDEDKALDRDDLLRRVLALESAWDDVQGLIIRLGSINEQSTREEIKGKDLFAKVESLLPPPKAWRSK